MSGRFERKNPAILAGFRNVWLSIDDLGALVVFCGQLDCFFLAGRFVDLRKLSVDELDDGGARKLE